LWLHPVVVEYMRLCLDTIGGIAVVVVVVVLVVVVIVVVGEVVVVVVGVADSKDWMCHSLLQGTVVVIISLYIFNFT